MCVVQIVNLRVHWRELVLVQDLTSLLYLLVQMSCWNAQKIYILRAFYFKKKLTISTLLFFFTVLDYIFKCLSRTVCFPQKLALGKLLQDLNSCFRDMENLLSGPEGAGVFFMVSETYIISNFTSKSMSCKNVKIIFSKFIKEKSPKIKRWKRMMDYLLLSP